MATRKSTNETVRKTATKSKTTAKTKGAAKAGKKTAPKKAGSKKPAPGKGSQAGGGKGNIRIRMYRIGFGDFFLLTVPGKSGPAHILIDCKEVEITLTPGTTKGQGTLILITANQLRASSPVQVQ